MNDSAKPQLALGTPPGKLKHSAANRGGRDVWLLVLLQVLTLAVVLATARRPESAGPDGSATTGGEDLQAVALSLEDRGLEIQAAQAWQTYLRQNPAATDRAEILYRMGKLYLRGEQYGEGAAALVRSEQAAQGDQALKDKIGPQLITCLRRLGRYGEVGRELSRQVEAGAGRVGQGPVLATLAGESLTESDLDRMIEQRVDQELRMAGAADDPATRQMLLKRFSDAAVRQQVLADLLRREVFTRRARELGLDQTDDFVRQRQMVEDDLLAGSFERRELAAVQPTRIDLESFFAGNRERYAEPESAEVACFALQPDEQAEDVLKDVRTAEDFRELAARRRANDSDDAQDPRTVSLVRGRNHPRLGDTGPLFDLEPGAWTERPHENADQRYLVLVEDQTPARTPAFNEVAARVEAEYLERKRREVLEQTFRELMTRYDVEIRSHTPEANPSPPADGDAQADE